MLRPVHLSNTGIVDRMNVHRQPRQTARYQVCAAPELVPMRLQRVLSDGPCRGRAGAPSARDNSIVKTGLIGAGFMAELYKIPSRTIRISDFSEENRRWSALSARKSVNGTFGLKFVGAHTILLIKKKIFQTISQQSNRWCALDE